MQHRSEDVAFRGPDGQLVGRAFMPISNINSSFPGAILVHGLGTDGRTMEQAARDLADQGVAALAFDLRGHGRSESVYRGDASGDIIAAAAFLSEKGGLDPARIGVMGHSSGAREAILACLRSPHLVALVCTSTPADGLIGGETFHQRIAAAFGPSPAVSSYPEDGPLPWLEGRPLRLTSWLWSKLRGYRLRILWAETLVQWARLRSDVAVMDMAPRPALFVHCLGDRTVPSLSSELLYQKTPGPEKQLLLVPGGWHAAPLARTAIRHRWTAWLAGHLISQEAPHGLAT